MRPAIELLLKRGVKIHIACTGAGAGVTNWLWEVPGASSTLIGSAFPYAQSEFDRFVGGPWSETKLGYCKTESAIALAQAGFFRAQEACHATRDYTSPILSVGLSAAVATNRVLRGGLRCFAALRTKNGIFTINIGMTQSMLREDCGAVCDLTALNLLLHGAGLPQVGFRDYTDLSCRDVSSNLTI